jgi:hypothetical protein
MDFGWIQSAGWKDEHSIGFWIRIFGKGIHVSTLPLNFSERNGYRKFLKIGKWKIKGLSD